MHRRLVAPLPMRLPLWIASARRDRLLTWLVGLAALLLYGWTAAPGIITFYDDSLELQLVAPTFAIAHPTGYPLYTLLGGLWTRLLPIGTWAGRMNLWSALAAAGAIALLFDGARRLATDSAGRPNPWAGLAAALAFGLGPVWWGQATVAEVYALHNLLVAAILAATLGIDRLQGAAQTRRMALVALLFGLGLAHHRTIVLLIPGVALYLLWSVPRLGRPQRAWGLWFGALFAPLLLYLYLPLAAARGAYDLSGSYANTWAGFWNHVLARQYTAFFGENPLAAVYGPTEWLGLLRDQMGWLALGLAGLGLLRLVDRHARPARAWIAVALIALTNLGFVLAYRVPDPEVFLLPVLLCAAIFVGGGVSLVARLAPPRWQPWPARLGQAALVILLALGVGGRGPGVNRHANWSKHDAARLMAGVPFPPGSLILGIEGEMTAVRYMQAAEGLGRNATPAPYNDPDTRRAAVDAALAAGRPVYLTRELPGLAERYSFSGEGPLVRVWPRGGVQFAPPRHPLDIALADGALRLVGYDARYSPVTAQPWLAVALDWQPQAPLASVFKVSFRLLDAAGAPLVWPDGRAAVEDRFPIHQMAPAPQWAVGDVVRDSQLLPVPPAQAAALDRLLIIVYDSTTVAEWGRAELPLPPYSPGKR